MQQTSHADPVDVQRREGNPEAFCWRGRVFRIQGVLAHWIETGPWGRSASVRALLAEDAGADESSGQREFWQVEAAAGRHAAPGVYELCADWSAGRPGEWSVTTPSELPTARSG